MHRGSQQLLALVFAAVLGCVLAASVAARPPRATVKLKQCSLEGHSALFHARMRAVRHTDRMRMRFALLERGGDGRYRSVDSDDLTHSHWSRHGVRSFGFRQELKGLTEGSAYKLSVRYRWYDADGDLIKSARKRSRACRQFTGLPNVRARLLGARRTKTNGVWRYDVRVRNTGPVEATNVPVRLTIDDLVSETLIVERLRAHSLRTLHFHRPACVTGYSVEADPDGTIPESNEGDNAGTGPCPFPAAA